MQEEKTREQKYKDNFAEAAKTMKTLIGYVDGKPNNMNCKMLSEFSRLAQYSYGMKVYIKRHNLSWSNFIGYFNKAEQKTIKEALLAFNRVLYRLIHRMKDDKIPKGLSRATIIKLGRMQKSLSEESQEISSRLLSGDAVKIKGKKISLDKNSPKYILFKLEYVTKKYPVKRIPDSNQETLDSMNSIRSINKYLRDYDARLLPDSALKKEYRRMKTGKILAKEMMHNFDYLEMKIGEQIHMDEFTYADYLDFWEL